MGQDTRKDPRAKVLTMTVRYKSATLDEFIEHHSHDISRGGMFIKTPSPFPPGTLLKFEVKIAEDQKLMQGVGRVVWKREPPEAGDERPAGMGVKFIKIDESSKRLIDQLVTTRGDGKSAYDVGTDDARPREDRVPAAPRRPRRPQWPQSPMPSGNVRDRNAAAQGDDDRPRRDGAGRVCAAAPTESPRGHRNRKNSSRRRNRRRTCRRPRIAR